MRHRNFRLYAAGQLISLTGSWVHNTALSWLMYRLTHSEWMLGAMSLLTNLPMLLLGPWGGLAADRYSRRTLVLVTQSVFCLQALLLAVLTARGAVSVWHVYALGLFYGLANAFDIPARQSMLLDLSSQEDLVSAISLNSLIFNFARIVGPSLGGLAVASIGESWCFAVNAVSFLAVLLGLLLMKLPERTPMAGEDNRSLREGLDWVRAHPMGAVLLPLCAILNVGFSGVFVLNPFFAEDVFELGPRGLGFLTAAMGCGAVAGTYLLASNRDATALPRVSLTSAFLLGGALMVYAWSPVFGVSLVAMALAGASLMRQNAATNSTLQTSVPPELRGRIVSLFGMAVVGMAPLGASLFGLTARMTGVRVAACGAAVLCLLAALWSMRRLRGVVALATLLLCCAPNQFAQSDLIGKVDEYLKEASELTGFKIKRKVPGARMSRVELDVYLKSKMKEDVNPGKTDAEELVLKRLGFAPPDFKLRATTIELLGEQAAAFYDFKAKKLFLLDQSDEALGPELLIHELGHALADQHFGLRKFLKGAAGDDDASLARMAVMEGQAMYLMGEHGARKAGMHLKDSPALVERLSEPDDGNDDKYPVMKRVPLYLKESLLFPYSYGLRFQAAVCQKDNDCMARVFRDPPKSSAAVMHPELYFAHKGPEAVKLPDPPQGKWKLRMGGNLGEFDLELLLRTHKAVAAPITKHWRGGGYQLLESKTGSHDLLLLHASIWEDEAAASRWFEAFTGILASKFQKLTVESRSPREWTGVCEFGRFRIYQQGRVVSAIEGLPLK